MLNAFLVAAVLSLPCAAEQSPFPLEGSLAALRRSTATADLEIWGREVVNGQARTEAEAKALVEALDHPPADRFARLAVSKSSAPATGAAFHQGMKAWVKRLERKGPRERGEEDKGGDLLNLMALIQAVGGSGYKAAIPDLRKLLDRRDSFWELIAPEAARALGKLGDEASFEKVMGQAERGEGVTAAGYGHRAIERLVKKIDAIRETYRTGPKKSDDPREKDIVRLAEEIGRAGELNPKAVPSLRKLIHHPDDSVRFWASHALIYALRPVPEDRAVTLEMLRSEDPIVQRRGLRSLYEGGKTWDKSFIPVIVGMMRDDPNNSVRNAAVEVLGTVVVDKLAKRKDLEETVPHLMAALNDQKSGAQDMAFRVLRIVTGRFYPYEGMTDDEKRRIEREPAYVPESDESNHESAP